MITREEAEQLRADLVLALAEDAHNTTRLLARLETLTRESGVGAHSALLLILTQLGFEENEARRHWQALLAHRDLLATKLGRDPGLRVALLDYFTNLNRALVEPVLIDLELKQASRADAEIDPATGLATERRFRSMLQGELRRARRYELPVAVVRIDIDEFGVMQERFGRLLGDRMLRELAILLNNSVRDIDVAGHPGGDEFCLLLPETDRNGGLLVAERFRRQVEAHFATRESGGQPVRLTVSAGVASYPQDGITVEEVLEHAARALYRAKAAGRNAVQAYQPERRRYLRFELEPGRFEVEVRTPPYHTRGRARNLSRNGILFDSPERLDVGEEIEIRLVDSASADQAVGALAIRGLVVRLEELPPAAPDPAQAATALDRYEVGVALDLDDDPDADDLLAFLERTQPRRVSADP